MTRRTKASPVRVIDATTGEVIRTEPAYNAFELSTARAPARKGKNSPSRKIARMRAKRAIGQQR